MKNTAARARLQHDMQEIQKTPGLETLNLTSSDGFDDKNQPIICWNMVLRGAVNSYWHRQEYDFQMQFDKRFPYEPPRLHFPNTSLNKRSIKHPLIGRNGNLDLDCVSKDHWNCTSTVINIIKEVQVLFSTNPDSSLMSTAEESILFQLPEEPLFGLVAYLPLVDILRLSTVCKKALLILHSNNLWAKIYYTRCQVPAAILYNTGSALLHAGPGPLREYTDMSKSFQWRHSREAFVRAHQCHLVTRHCKVPSLQSLAAGELSVLLPLAYPAELTAARAQPWDSDEGTDGQPSQQSGQKRSLSDTQRDSQLRSRLEAEGFEIIDSTTAPTEPGVLAPPQPQQQTLLSLHHMFNPPHHGHGAPHHLHAAQDHPGAAALLLSVLPPGTESAYSAALRYRALRSCRLAQWLGGADCITANIVHNYWSNLPITFMQFLCSLSVHLGQQGTPRTLIAHRLQTEAAHAARECSLHISHTERHYHGLRTVGLLAPVTDHDWDPSVEGQMDMGWDTSETEAAVGASSGDVLSQVPGYNTKLPAYRASSVVGAPTAVVTLPMSLSDVFGGSALDSRALQSNDPAVRARLRLAQDLLRNNGARSVGVKETCNNFENIRTVSTDESAFGPDIYDIVERLHELNIAFSYQFRDMQTEAKLDCLDQNNDWVEAKVLNKSKSVFAAMSNVFSLESKPTDSQVLLRAHYLVSEIKLRDYRHFVALMQNSRGAFAGTSHVTALSAYDSDTHLKVTEASRYHQRHQMRTWLCLCCTMLNHSAQGVCRACSTDNYLPLYMYTKATDARIDHITRPLGTKNCVDQAVGSVSAAAGPARSTIATTSGVFGYCGFGDFDYLDSDDEAGMGMGFESLQHANLSAAIAASTAEGGAHPLFDAGDFALFLQLVPQPGAPANNSLFLSEATTLDQRRRRFAHVRFMRHLPPNFHALPVDQQREYYLQWRHLHLRVPLGGPIAPPAGRPAPSAPAAPTAPHPWSVDNLERQPGSTVVSQLRDSTSPYFMFNAQQASSFLRQFCAVLEEEQTLEFRTAAAFTVARQTLTERPLSPGCTTMESETNLREMLGPFPTATAAAMSLPQLLDAAVPVTAPWPAARPAGDSYGISYWMDVLNSQLRHNGIHGAVGSVDRFLSTRQYDGFNLARRLYELSTITAHFTGYDSKFDERVAVVSARLAPCRTHTSRAQSVCMSSVGELLIRAQDQARGVSSARHSQSVANQLYPFDLPGSLVRANHAASARHRQAALTGGDQSPVNVAAMDTSTAALPSFASTGSLCADGTVSSATSPKPKDAMLEIKLRCLWHCSRPGGGIVSYRVPAHMKLLAIAKDFCDILALNLAQVKVVLIDMIQCIRYAYERRIPTALQSEWSEDAACAKQGVACMRGVLGLDLSSTLEELSVTNNSTIDIMYKPLRDEYFA